MGRKSKKARKIRTSDEFDRRRLEAQLRPPVTTVGDGAWDLSQILAARDAQLRGNFWLPVRMAASMRADDALFVAYCNRLAPQRCIGVELRPPRKGALARRVADEAEGLFGVDGIGVHPDTLSDINGSLANHGIAIGIIDHNPRADGSRIDLILNSWPLEFVRWDPIARQLLTRVEEVPDVEAAALESAGLYIGAEVPINHGDGRWVVFAKHQLEPWKQEACLLAASLVWARHASSVRDWVNGSTAHGNAKIVGEMPEGLEITKQDGSLTTEAIGFMTLLERVANNAQPYGLRPAGSKVDFIANSSNAWQVWHELTTNAEKASARIYLGTDGMLGSVGGAPGVDIATLFGVATTIIQGDLGAIERGLLTGLIEPWAAMNFGDSTLAPKRIYQIPDADADAARDSYGKRAAAFHEDIKAHRDGGFVVDQQLVDALATRYGIDAPQLASSSAPAAALFSYHLEFGILTTNEIRARLGLGPIAGGDTRPLPSSAIGAGAPALPAAARPPLALAASDKRPIGGDDRGF